jgi:hypothetical protein
MDSKDISMKLNKIIFIIIAIAAVYFFQAETPSSPPALSSVPATSTNPPSVSRFTQNDAGKQVQGNGVVTRVLTDDNDGSRHQRFIIRLASGQTLLVAHNIDLAPRVGSIAVNDTVAFNGEYEWNSQGGVVHWTHHDPDGRHVGGWLKHQGRTYQ